MAFLLGVSAPLPWMSRLTAGSGGAGPSLVCLVQVCVFFFLSFASLAFFPSRFFPTLNGGAGLCDCGPGDLLFYRLSRHLLSFRLRVVFFRDDLFCFGFATTSFHPLPALDQTKDPVDGSSHHAWTLIPSSRFMEGKKPRRPFLSGFLSAEATAIYIARPPSLSNAG